MSEKIELIGDYVARGWRVFPIKHGTKKPHIEAWPVRATTDLKTINGWWEEWPDDDVGIATGEMSGFFGLDIDVKNGKKGRESLEQLETEHCKLPETYTVITGTGGEHRYFSWPDGRDLRNKTDFRNGLDIRANGGYLIAPPSIHPDTGNPYKVVMKPAEKMPFPWLSVEQKPFEIAPAPDWLIEIIDPPKVETEPIKVQKPVRRTENVSETPIIERARAYLHEIPGAIQGQAGHNALLWAARCLVHGFLLSESEAISLLWSEYNPRCSPPWDAGSPSDVKDFERKAHEAAEKPFDKPKGWLLTEYNLMTETDAMASIIGANFAKRYIAGKEESTEQVLGHFDSIKDEFPIHCLPEQIENFIKMVSEVQVVQPAGVALSVLVAAGGAMGNAFRLRIKGGFDVPPILWGAIVSSSGSNKSGPFREIIKPLRQRVMPDTLTNIIRNPQGQVLIEDATTEAILGVMGKNPRGLLMANGEGAGWIGAFDRYSQGSKKKSVSVDETIWLKMWDCDTYQRNRKTDDENTLIHSAACGVLVNIQPKKMAEVFDPSQFASGLVPRLLVVYLPKSYRPFSEREMLDADVDFWKRTIMTLRSYPFESQDPNTGQYYPNIIKLAADAKECYVNEWNRLEKIISDSKDEISDLFYSKAKGITGRIALVLHGLGAACDKHNIMEDITLETMQSAIEITRYLVRQQLSVYNIAGESYIKQRIAETLAVAQVKKKITTRTLQRVNMKRWPTAEIAKHDMEQLVKAGYGRIVGNEFLLTEG